ncbi:hypothetical protein ACEQ8H_006227 [Pleosporales sp. CAS-2024a]
MSTSRSQRPERPNSPSGKDSDKKNSNLSRFSMIRRRERSSSNSDDNYQHLFKRDEAQDSIKHNNKRARTSNTTDVGFAAGPSNQSQPPPAAPKRLKKYADFLVAESSSSIPETSSQDDKGSQAEVYEDARNIAPTIEDYADEIDNALRDQDIADEAFASNASEGADSEFGFPQYNDNALLYDALDFGEDANLTNTWFPQLSDTVLPEVPMANLYDEEEQSTGNSLLREKYARLLTANPTVITRFIKEFVENVTKSKTPTLSDSVLDRATKTLGQRSSTAMSIGDVLALWYEEDRPSEAWLTDALITTLVENDSPFNDAHFEPTAPLQLYLSGDILPEALATARFQTAIVTAKEGRQPEFGFPMVGLPPTATKALFFFNPSRSHWVVAEINCEEGPKILLYNPSNTQQKGHAISTARREIPLLAELTAFRPGSMFAKEKWLHVTPVSQPCPQQAKVNIDCALFSLFIMLHRLNGRDLPPEIEQDNTRHGFGQWLREQAAVRLTSMLRNVGGPSLLSLFLAGQPNVSLSNDNHLLLDTCATVENTKNIDDLAFHVSMLDEHASSIAQMMDFSLDDIQLNIGDISISHADILSLFDMLPLSRTVISAIVDAEPHPGLTDLVPESRIRGLVNRLRNDKIECKGRSIFMLQCSDEAVVVDANFAYRTFGVYNPSHQTQEKRAGVIQQVRLSLKTVCRRFAWKQVEIVEMPSPMQPTGSLDNGVLCLYILILLLHGRTIPGHLDNADIRMLRQLCCVRLEAVYVQDMHEAKESLLRLLEGQYIDTGDLMQVDDQRSTVLDSEDEEPAHVQTRNTKSKQKAKLAAHAPPSLIASSHYAYNDDLFIPEELNNRSRSDQPEDLNTPQRSAKRKGKAKDISNNGELHCTYCDYSVPVPVREPSKQPTRLRMHMVQHLITDKDLKLPSDMQTCEMGCGIGAAYDPYRRQNL